MRAWSISTALIGAVRVPSAWSSCAAVSVSASGPSRDSSGSSSAAPSRRGIAQHERAAVGEVHAEAMPLRDAPVARVDERVAGLLAVDDHAPAHAEMHAEPGVGVGGVEHDLLAGPARRGERVADERVPQRGRASCPA